MKLHYFWYLFFVCCGAWSASSTFQDGSIETVWEEDFEKGSVGGMPPGWFSPAAGKPATLSVKNPTQGRFCARIETDNDHENFANLIASLPMDARTAGKRVRLRGHVRVEHDPNAWAQLWLRFDYSDGTSVLVDNMHDRPIGSKQWEEYEIVADLVGDSGSIVVGLMLFGSGSASLDDVRLELVGEAPASQARELAEQELDNLTAFARLFGTVRWFHPSDQVYAADWSAFCVSAVPAVTSAKNSSDLAEVLLERFSTVAPTMAIAEERKKPTLHPSLRRPKGKGDFTITAWQHLGMGTSGDNNQAGPYSSHRSYESLKGRRLPDGFSDPAKPYRVPLGNGWVALVPLSLYVNNGATLPQDADIPEVTAPEPSLPSVTGVLQGSGDAWSDRIASVVIAWNVFQHFYPYFDVVPVAWSEELRPAIAKASQASTQDEFTRVLQRLGALLQDGHFWVSPAIATRSVGRLPLEWMLIDEELVITWVDSDAKLDLAPGDMVRTIDGIPAVVALGFCEALCSGATPQFRRHRALAALLEGPFSLTAKLEVVRGSSADGESRQVAVEYGWSERSSAETKPESVAELEEGVWYIDLDRAATEDFVSILDRLADAKGLIFDLRGYPSRFDAFEFFPHLIKEPVRSPYWCVPQLSRPNQEGMSFAESHWTIEPDKPFLRAKKAFITDAHAISYAESCLGIVEHYKLAEIVGGPTAGTNGNVNPFELPAGYSMSWTGMKVLKHDRSNHHGVGILPTIEVKRTIEGIAAGRDEFLEAALAAVR